METAKITNLYTLEQTIAGEYLSQFTYPWEALKGIGDFIRTLGPTLDPDIYEQRGEDIWVAKNATVFESAHLHGPLIIDEETEIRQCAFIRGSAIVGKGCVVGNSTELKNVILFNSVQVPHYNYVGDSILGYKSHMGAGSITSNVKSDKTLVVVKDIYDTKEEMETGLKKFGAMLGDYVEVGCNSVLNPGTVVGPHSNVYPLSRVRGVIPAETIFKDAEHIVKKSIMDH
jgi:NDP-sugar pyrophosphorylase family protein